MCCVRRSLLHSHSPDNALDRVTQTVFWANIRHKNEPTVLLHCRHGAVTICVADNRYLSRRKRICDAREANHGITVPAAGCRMCLQSRRSIANVARHYSVDSLCIRRNMVIESIHFCGTVCVLSSPGHHFKSQAPSFFCYTLPFRWVADVGISDSNSNLMKNPIPMTGQRINCSMVISFP